MAHFAGIVGGARVSDVSADSFHSNATMFAGFSPVIGPVAGGVAAAPGVAAGYPAAGSHAVVGGASGMAGYFSPQISVTGLNSPLNAVAQSTPHGQGTTIAGATTAQGQRGSQTSQVSAGQMEQMPAFRLPPAANTTTPELAAQGLVPASPGNTHGNSGASLRSKDGWSKDGWSSTSTKGGKSTKGSKGAGKGRKGKSPHHYHEPSAPDPLSYLPGMTAGGAASSYDYMAAAGPAAVAPDLQYMAAGLDPYSLQFAHAAGVAAAYQQAHARAAAYPSYSPGLMNQHAAAAAPPAGPVAGDAFGFGVPGSSLDSTSPPLHVGGTTTAAAEAALHHYDPAGLGGNATLGGGHHHAASKGYHSGTSSGSHQNSGGSYGLSGSTFSSGRSGGSVSGGGYNNTRYSSGYGGKDHGWGKDSWGKDSWSTKDSWSKDSWGKHGMKGKGKRGKDDDDEGGKGKGKKGTP